MRAIRHGLRAINSECVRLNTFCVRLAKKSANTIGVCCSPFPQRNVLKVKGAKTWGEYLEEFNRKMNSSACWSSVRESEPC